MKRKILRAGRSSLAVSFPKEYVDDNHLEPGKEINVEHLGTNLVVSCEQPKLKEKVVDLQHLSDVTDLQKVGDKVLGALFRQGLDSFVLNFADEQSTDTVRGLLQTGKDNLFEDPDASDRMSVAVRISVSHFDADAMDHLRQAIIKHIFHTFEDFITCIQKGKLSRRDGERLMERDHYVNTQTDICKRIINKNVRSYRSTASYLIVDKFEKIGDEVKNLVQIALDDPDAVQEEISSILALKEFFHLLYQANHGFSEKRMVEFYNKYYEMMDSLANSKNIYIYHSCRTIISLMKDLYSALMVAGL